MCATLATSPQHRVPLRRFAPLLPALLITPLALSVRYTADFGLAYRGGLEAWATGHPQRLASWTAMPFLAVPMATITRLASEETAARFFMAAVSLIPSTSLIFAKRSLPSTNRPVFALFAMFFCFAMTASLA